MLFLVSMVLALVLLSLVHVHGLYSKTRRTKQTEKDLTKENKDKTVQVSPGTLEWI